MAPPSICVQSCMPPPIALHCCGFSKVFVFLLDLDGVVCQKHLFKDLSLQTVSGICKGFRKS